MRILRIMSTALAAFSALAVIVWLVAANLVPSGKFVARWRPGQPNALLGPVAPESRLLPLNIAADGTPYQSLVEEPVNFDVRLPSAFDTAKVTVVFSGEPRIVEIGGLASRETWTNDLRPAHNSIIDYLGWSAVEGDGLTLYEREKKFDSVGDFLADMPPSGVAAYKADVGGRIKLANYSPASAAKTYKTAFRGSAVIKAYLENERLDFRFRVQEVNRHANADGFFATATIGGVRVARAEYADDGNDTADGRLSGLRELRLHSEKPLTGIVKIELPAGDDVVFRETSALQRKFVFANRFYAADNVGYLKAPAAFSIVTNGRRLYATTAHPEAFQKLSAGSHALSVDDVNKPFAVSLADDIRKSGSAEITAPYGDLRLETAGLFAFDKESFFNPDPLPLTWETDVDQDGINYIITSYVPPQRKGEWRTASAVFDLSRLSIVSRAANFTISVPGISFEQKELRLASIEVELRRKPLSFSDIRPALLKMWRSITGQEKEIVNNLRN